MEQKLRNNLPTCINVDWEKAYIELEQSQEGILLPQDNPRVYQLETTSLCNLKCIMCPHSKLTRPKKIMDEKLFRTIVDRDMGWTKAIELFGFGEAFTDPYIETRISYLQSKGHNVVIATNGLLAHKVSDETIKKIDYLIIDIDAISKEDYEKIRIGGDYYRLINNLEWILRIRKKYTVLQFINIDKNKSKIKRFLNKYEGRADEVRIKFLDTFAGQIGKTTKQKHIRCLEPFYGVSIWSNGDVVMCDRDFNSKHKLGNVNEKSLKEIWEDKILAEITLRHSIDEGEKIKLCSHCREWKLTNFRNVPELTVNMFKGGTV